MKKATVYKCDDGQLEEELNRAKAKDLAYAVGRATKEADGAARDPKTDFHVAMELMRFADIVKQHIDEYIALRDEEKMPKGMNELFQS